MNTLLWATLLFPVLGFLGLVAWMKFKPTTGVYVLMSMTLLALLCSIVGLWTGGAKLSYLLSSLILLVCFNIQAFSLRYLQGDSQYKSFFIKLALLGIVANAMVFATHLGLFWLFWTLNNALLISLMIHKSSWTAAKSSGLLAFKTLGFGSLCLGLACLLLPNPEMRIGAQLLIIIAAMCQSAIWPFHRWLLSSLNSPTPVSALMHAGMVNGGGILLVKFYYLFQGDSTMLGLIFVLGLVTAILGGFYKLIQFDIKRMLANSTMAQMGFMIMQCGMGLYAAAIAHLCWHGLFKAYLFLNSGSALKGKFVPEQVKVRPINYFWVIIGTALAVVSFCYTAAVDISVVNIQWLLVALVAITAWQLSVNFVGRHHIVTELLMIVLFSSIYGGSIYLIEQCFTHEQLQFVALNGVYIAGFIVLFLLWGVLNSPLMKRLKAHRLWHATYVKGLNASQPVSQTVSAIRKRYEF